MNSKLMLLALGSALLAACGGGGVADLPGATPDPSAAVPASASQSEPGLASYLLALSQVDADALEPLEPGSFEPLASDSSEPQPAD